MSERKKDSIKLSTFFIVENDGNGGNIYTKFERNLSQVSLLRQWIRTFINTYGSIRGNSC